MRIVLMCERELRRLIGELEAVVGWPDKVTMVSVRQRVSSWVAGLEKERLRWVVEHGKEVKANNEQVAKWLKAAEQRAEQKRLSEEARRDAEELTKQYYAEVSAGDIPVPENFTLALQILQEAR